jgi:hypothetical protein
MKKLNFKVCIKLLLAGFIILLLTPSCEKNEEIVEDGINTEDLMKLKSLGFSPEDIEVQGDYYVAERDILISKESLQHYETVESDANLKQASNPTVYHIPYNERDIAIYLDQSTFPTIGENLNSALNGVINKYNACNSFLVFRRGTASDHDIIIRPNDDLYDLPEGNSACGQAPLPFYGPGNYIEIDPGFFSYAYNTYAHLFHVVAHELGHTIGLHHTDWTTDPNLASYSGSTQPVNIPGTPTSDANSIMNWGGCGSTDTDLSYWDKIAVRKLYPGLSVNITGPYDVPCYSFGTWSANVTGSRDALTYLWTYRIYENNTLVESGSASTQSIRLFFESTASLYLNVHVLSGGQSADDTRNLMNQCQVLP